MDHCHTPIRQPCRVSGVPSSRGDRCVGRFRVFNALCGHQQLRGIVVQQGGARALIGLALEGTKKGKHQAAQALSRIAITINPATAFPGQRVRLTGHGVTGAAGTAHRARQGDGDSGYGSPGTAG